MWDFIKNTIVLLVDVQKFVDINHVFSLLAMNFMSMISIFREYEL